MINKDKINAIIEEIGLETPIPYTWIVTAIEYIKNRKTRVGTGDRRSFYDMLRLLYYTAYSDMPPEVGLIHVLKEIEVHITPVFERLAKINNYKKHKIKDIKYILDDAVLDMAFEITNDILDLSTTTQIFAKTPIEKLTPLQIMDPLFDLKFVKGEFHALKDVKYPGKSNVVVIEDNSMSMNNANSLEKTLGILKALNKKANIVHKYHCSDRKIVPVDVFDINRHTHPITFNLNLYLEKIHTKLPVIVITDCHYREIKPIEYSGNLIIFDLRGNKILKNHNNNYTYRWL